MSAVRPLVLDPITKRTREARDTDTFAGLSGTQTRTLNFFGSLVPTTGTVKFYPDKTINITNVYAVVGVQSNSPISANLKKNGVVVGSVSISANTDKSSIQNLSIALTTSDYLTADLATTGGENLSITLVYS